jgi:ubiquinol-cytochrome c reductase cytochrome b subunit
MSIKEIKKWIDFRLPIFTLINNFCNSKVPSNLNFLWSMGAVAIFAILLQMLSGIFISFHYIPHIDYAYQSILNILNNVHYGWFILSMHQICAGLFFLVLYLHIFKAIYYQSYKFPRELLWCTGVFLFHMIMLIAFLGFLLPMSEKGFWSASVIINLIGDIPYIGLWIKSILLGGDAINTSTLGRFFILHIIMPFMLLFIIIIHIIAVKQHGSNNPALDKNIKKINFFPKLFFFDILAVFIFLSILFVALFFFSDNFTNLSSLQEASRFSTPNIIKPEWYFLPFFAMVKVSSTQIMGLLTIIASNIILYFLPWLDKSVQKSCNIHKIFTIIFALNFIILGWIGYAENTPNILYYCSVTYYFLYFIIILPFMGRIRLFFSK